MQEYDVQHTRVHTDRSHKRQPVVAMSLLALMSADTSPDCMPRAGWNVYTIKSIREGNG